MTKRLVLAMAILGLAAFVAPPAIAGEEEGGEGKINFHFMSRVRYENLDNYFDYEDHDNGVGHDRLAFWPYRNMFGFKAKLAENVWANMDVQNVGALGNQTPLLSQADPVNQHYDDNFITTGMKRSDTYLYRAVIGMDEIGGTGLGIAVGRQELNLGTGLILGNEPFYSGIVFDGVVGWYKFENWALKGFYLNTAERNDVAGFVFGGAGFQDQRLYGGVGSIWFGGDDMKQMVDVYVMMGRDGLAAVGNPELMTYGAHYWRDIETAEQANAFGLNWNVEIAMQTGDQDVILDPDQQIDIGGMIVEAEVGWTFAADSILHGPFVGMFMTSGDDDPNDDSQDGWVPLFPTEHGRLGAADFFGQGYQNSDTAMTAYNIGYWVKAGNHKAYVKYWMFQPTEDSRTIVDPTNPPQLIVVDIEDYGDEIDLGYSYKYSDNLHIFASIAQLSPDEGLTDDFNPATDDPDDSVTRIYGGLYLKFH